MSRRLREMRLSRVRARAENRPEKFAEKAGDLGALQKSVEDAAAVSIGFWLSYLFTLFYLGIAVASVTHRDLLLENPVKLPFLNIDLPLVGFFLVAPMLFLVIHAYALVHFVMLAVKVGAFSKKLRQQIPDTHVRQEIRRQLPPNILVQFLAGPRDMRNSLFGWLLKAIAWFSLVAAPVVLLLLIQVQFLPYHLEWLTWVQRFAVLADVILLWALWPAVLESRSKIKWPRLIRFKWMTLASLVAIGLAFTAATFPGEWADEWIGKRQWIPSAPTASRNDQKNWMSFIATWLGQEDRTSFHDLLFSGKVDRTSQRRASPFSNTIVLPYFDEFDALKIDDPKKLNALKRTLVLRGRHLESAVVSGADLRKADLEGAQLQDAALNSAHLQGASLFGADLQGAALDGADLQGASLEKARLRGASLDHAHLQGAALNNARLHGASVNGAQLQGASLDNAQLQGVSFKGAQLQGASFENAQLLLASLEGAQLQGAVFLKSTLVGATLNSANVWRTRFKDAPLTADSEDDLQESATSKKDFAKLKSAILEEVPEGHNREAALKRIEILNTDIFGPEENAAESLEKGRVTTSAFLKVFKDELVRLACSGDDDDNYVLTGVMESGRIPDTGPIGVRLMEAILSPTCPAPANPN
jgi:uncharacterized protein YjbI with pentapeptide repeats